MTQTRNTLQRLGTAALALGLGLGLAASGAAQPLFTEATAAAGLSFKGAFSADTPGLPMRGGGTVGDFNNDGWPDLFVVGGGLNTDRLYINQKNGTFLNKAAAAGINLTHRGNGSSAADYDRDGDMDIFVASMGDMTAGPRNGVHILWRNNGNGTFTNVAVEAGVNSTGSYPDGYGVAWGDYDLDGDLDLWVGGWHDDGFGFSANTRLFRNNLVETGVANFTDVTAELGLFVQSTQGFGAIFNDMDGDRYPELLVAGDFGTSKYYANTRDGGFVLAPILSPGDSKVHNGMGTTIGDFNRDGKPDWFVTAIVPAWNSGICGGLCGNDELPAGNRLYLNKGTGLGVHEFASVPAFAGVNDGGWGWGTSVIDFNHDGWQDIVMTNGWLNCEFEAIDEYINEPTYLFENNKDGTFTEVGQFYGLDNHFQGRGLVTFDYDRDGDMDVVNFSNPERGFCQSGEQDDPATGELRLYRNDISGPGTNWLEINLDTAGNPALAPNGYGSRVSVTRATATQVDWINGGSNFLGRSQLVAHFGVGGTTTLDEVKVEWADGFQTVMTNVPANQIMTIAASLPLTDSGFVRGNPVDLVVTGMRPGEQANFVFSGAGIGSGPCFAALGGLCTDLLSPRLAGRATAGADGVATLTLNVPQGAPNTAYVQVLVQRGESGLGSYKSNVDVAQVQ